VINPWITRLVSIAGLDACHDEIQKQFHEQLGAVDLAAPAAPRTSGLTRNGGPVEFGLTFDRGKVIGFKYTIDLLAADPGWDVCNRIHHLASGMMDAAPVDALVQAVQALRGDSSGGAVYWSVGLARGAPPRVRVHVVGKAASLDRQALERLDRSILPRHRLTSVLAAAGTLGKSAVDIACLGPAADGSVRCKLYVLTDPYIDLTTVTRLALTLGLPTGHSLSLLRWYAGFVGRHEGQLGAFGLGIDVSSRSGGGGVEAYAYPGERLLPSLQRQVARCADAADSVWKVLDQNEPSGAHLVVTGCGVETASFARLGRITAYLHPVHN
jgi:hypothetical protein